MNHLEAFRALGISECVLAALQQKGFEEPSPIQKQTIPLLLKGEKDVIGQAQTGTGKPPHSESPSSTRSPAETEDRAL